MSIHADHPSVLEFKLNEVKSLEYLHTRKLLKQFRELDKTITLTIFNYKNKERLEVNDFEFHAAFPVNIQGHQHDVFVEARIRGNYEEATYLLAINDKDDPQELIRKFHFDFAHPSIPTNQPVPIFHLQYGGKKSNFLDKLNMQDNKIDRWLSVPRLVYFPINIAILLDIVFCELGTDDTQKVVQTPEWRNLIFDNERFILEKYYRAIAARCNASDCGPKKLIRDFCYGRS